MLFLKYHRKLVIFFALLILGFVFYKLIVALDKPKNVNFENKSKQITIIDDGVNYQVSDVSSDTVADFLKEKNFKISESDYVFPNTDSKIYDNSFVIIKRSKNISILADGKTVKGKTLGTNVAMALWDNDIKLREDDFTIPSMSSPIKNSSSVEVVRVDIREETVKKEVDFEIKSTEDDKLSWRTKKVSQKGVKGIDEYIYKVISHNGKEISRKLLSKERTKDPIPEINVQGTYMKLGKVNNGFGTWYSWKKGLFAASPWLPMGSYAKVTNKENGKSVVVQINDRGPFGPNRIIDLDKVAFEKIANLGAGVIDVKVEQILN